MLIGYVRCVPTGADETAQIKMMVDHSVNKVFTEQTGSRSIELKARQDLLNFAREGDTILVDNIHVIARSVGELLDIMSKLAEQNVQFVSVSEGIDTNTEKGQFLMSVLKSIADLDTDSIVGQRRDEDAAELAAKAAQDAARPAQPQSKILTPPNQNQNQTQGQSQTQARLLTVPASMQTQGQNQTQPPRPSVPAEPKTDTPDDSDE